MLSSVVCTFNNIVPHHSRNAYVTWKDKSKISLKKICYELGISKKHYGNLCSDNVAYRNLRKHDPLNGFPVSLRYIYWVLKLNYPSSFYSTTTAQKRFLNNVPVVVKSKWKKSTTYVLALIPDKLFKRQKPKRRLQFPLQVDDGSTNQYVLGFPHFFDKHAAFNSQYNNAFHDKDNIKELDNDTNIIVESSSNSSTDFSNTSINKNNANDKDLAESKSSSILYESSAGPVKRSQYENIVSSLTTQESTQLTEEKSVKSVFKYLVKVPVNSFFSFISRTNALENDSVKKDEHTDKTSVKSVATKESIHPTPALSPSVLEILYQYIPYVRSSITVPKTESQTQPAKVMNQAAKIEAERERLHQKVNINNRTRYLFQAVRQTTSLFSLIQHVEELKDHLLRFPDTRITAVKENGIKDIMHVYRTTHDTDLLPTLRMILAMLGAVDPPKRSGIRLLSIDGGGSRGIACVEVCRRLVELTGRPINELFDYICGVSTGAILGFAFGVKKKQIDEVSQLYRDLSSQIFTQSRIAGTGGLFRSHSYYSTENFQHLMKKVFGSQLLIETAADEDVPKCSAVSTLVNRLPLKPFLWRNYSVVPGTRDTHWSGTSRATMWEAVRASAAAPGYFEEYKKGYNIHQDGGVLTNNPSGVALNECRLLWPNEPIACVVSIGTGRYEPVVGPVGEEFSSLKDKLMKFVDSATNVTEMHKVMYDLLPPGTYFRFNPFIDEPLLLNEYREEKLDLLVENTVKYVEKNDYKFRRCADALLDKKVYWKNS